MIAKPRKLKFNSTYGFLLDHFIGNNRNIRKNPCYKPKQKYSRPYQWFWRNVEHEKLYEEMHKKAYPFPPCIDFCDLDGHTHWLIKNMVKYGLVTEAGDGYEVTDAGRAFYEDWLGYMKDIGVRT